MADRIKEAQDSWVYMMCTRDITVSYKDNEGEEEYRLQLIEAIKSNLGERVFKNYYFCLTLETFLDI